MAKLKMVFDDKLEVVVSLREDVTPTVEALLDAAPFAASANRWGDEVYFEAPSSAGLEEDARDEMSVGEVAFWPDGNAIAVFFGPTPVSKADEPRAYSPCNIVGRVDGDAQVLKAVQSGAKVRVSKLDG